jgi:diguanylate cyclase (GGDEF)-like protein/PAS domain S-box-containing protein
MSNLVGNRACEDELLGALANFKYALDEATIVMVTDSKGSITYVNSKLCEISKYSKEELLGRDHRFVHAGTQSMGFYQEMWSTMIAGEVWRGKVKNNVKDGGFYWVDTTIVPVKNELGSPIQYISICHDITQHKQAEEALRISEERYRFLSYCDALTGFCNRDFFKKELETSLQSCGKAPMSIMVLDVDRFKFINDAMGQDFGDRVLKGIGILLAGKLNIDALISRQSADKFVVMLPETGTELACQIAQTILSALEEPLIIADYEVYISLSIGISTSPAHGHDSESLIKSAELAMNRIKESGGNQFLLYNSDMAQKLLGALYTEYGLRKALEQGHFTVHYQPKVNVRTGELLGSEALVRWKHPERGLLSPAEFIPIAEQTGLIVPMGDWVLREACRQHQAWRDEGYPPMRVSVNLSLRQFLQSDLVAKVERILGETGFNPRDLMLEITESTIMEHTDHVVATLKALKSLGIQLAMDDFGTGYSSLSRIKLFPLDMVKIDQSFIKNMLTDPYDDSIIEAIIKVAHSLNITVLAEGVEQAEQWTALKEKQCDEAQGYLFSKPLGKFEFESQILSRISFKKSTKRYITA